jgi:hypothetical protein
VSDRMDFDELAGGGDLTAEERARLERVHELLVTAGPPPELPPHLAELDLDGREKGKVMQLPRRRVGLALGLAAAIALTAFLGGFVAGHGSDTFPAAIDVPMHGTALAANATATIRVAKVDSNGNWPLEVVVHDLKPLPKGQYYEMFLTDNGKAVATCGTFRLSSGERVRLNAPYDLRSFDGWIVTREGPGSTRHAVVLRTKTV